MKPEFFGHNIRHAIQRRTELNVLKRQQCVEFSKEMLDLVTSAAQVSKSKRSTVSKLATSHRYERQSSEFVESEEQEAKASRTEGKSYSGQDLGAGWTTSQRHGSLVGDWHWFAPAAEHKEIQRELEVPAASRDSFDLRSYVADDQHRQHQSETAADVSTRSQ